MSYWLRGLTPLLRTLKGTCDSTGGRRKCGTSCTLGLGVYSTLPFCIAVLAAHHWRDVSCTVC